MDFNLNFEKRLKGALGRLVGFDWVAVESETNANAILPCPKKKKEKKKSNSLVSAAPSTHDVRI